MTSDLAWKPLEFSHLILLSENKAEDEEEWDKKGRHIESYVPDKTAEFYHKRAHRDADINQLNALHRYKDDSARYNRPLRSEMKKLHPKTSETINHLKTLTSHVIPHDFHGFRGFQNVDLSKLKKGDIIQDKGFTGLSRDYETARGHSKAEHGNREEYDDNVHYHVARVHVPKGSKGFYADQVDRYNTGEKETILHPKTSFHVIGKSVTHEERDGKDHYHHIIHMRAESHKG